MSGLPLNYQLTDVGGHYLDTRKTSDNYRLFALPGGPPYRPGLVKNKPGVGIELEIWQLSKAAFGHFVSQIPSPLGIGKVELENGDQVCGFLCEAHALADARDITEFTSWRKFLADIKDLKKHGHTNGRPQHTKLKIRHESCGLQSSFSS